MTVKEEKGIHIVTSNFIPGFKVKEVKGLVWASSVRSKFFLEDLKAHIRMFLGGEVNEYTNLLNEGRWEIMNKLNSNAKKMNANAVIDMKMATSQLIGSTVEMLAYGTAVVIEKEKK